MPINSRLFVVGGSLPGLPLICAKVRESEGRREEPGNVFLEEPLNDA